MIKDKKLFDILSGIDKKQDNNNIQFIIEI